MSWRQPMDDVARVPGPWSVAHDFTFALGGAERVTALLANEVLDAAPVYAFGGDREPMVELGCERLYLMFPKMFDANNYRLRSLVLPLVLNHRQPIPGNLIASSYAFAHHVQAEGVKVVYCHSPLRQIWSGASVYARDLRPPVRLAYRQVAAALRAMDRSRASQADAYVANSRVVASRIKRFYGLDDVPVVYPPVDERFDWAPKPRSDHYLWVGRIVEPYKRLSLVLEAFERTDRRLRVVGDGRDRQRLEAMAPANVEFVGSLATEELAREYRDCRALIFPSEDDFGMVPPEAMACGAPVVAIDRGGASETVRDAVTGVHFSEVSSESLLRALERFESLEFSSSSIAMYAKNRFSTMGFVEGIRSILSEHV
jgi:glycosyltransferase involved in cell wall biosynthesis